MTFYLFLTMFLKSEALRRTTAEYFKLYVSIFFYLTNIEGEHGCKTAKTIPFEPGKLQKIF